MDTLEQLELLEPTLQYPNTPNLYFESSASERLGTTGLVIVAMRRNASATTSSGIAAEFVKSFMRALYLLCSSSC